MEENCNCEETLEGGWERLEEASGHEELAELRRWAKKEQSKASEHQHSHLWSPLLDSIEDEIDDD